MTEPKVAPMQGGLKPFEVVEIYDDKENPRYAILDQNDMAFRVTIWIVIIKILLGSLLLFYFGYRNKRKEEL